jgi:hypothetical protein
MIEDGVLQSGLVEFGDYSRVTRLGANQTPHASLVGAVIAGRRGMAPGAKLYSASARYYDDFHREIERLLDERVYIINMSAGFWMQGVYEAVDKWIDYISAQRNVSFVTSAGNNAGRFRRRDGTISAPGMAYNAITVGSIGAVDIPDPQYTRVSEFSSFVHARGTANKPDIMAPGARLNTLIGGRVYTSSGTSFSSPHIAGMLALLMEGVPELKFRPELAKAIVMVSGDRKVPLVTGEPVESMFELTNRQGAGIVNVRNALTSGIYEHYVSRTLRAHQGDVFLDPVELTPDVPNTIVMTWFMQHTSVPGVIVVDNPNLALTDLDLEVYDSSGELVIGSYSRTNNVELVRFTPVAGEEYTFRVIRESDHETDEPFAIAWSSPQDPLREGITLPESTIMALDTTELLPLTIAPAGMSQRFWSSDNEDVATVDANGRVTAHEAGEAEITVLVRKHGGDYITRSHVTVIEANTENSPKVSLSTTPPSAGAILTHHRVTVTIEPAITGPVHIWKEATARRPATAKRTLMVP